MVLTHFEIARLQYSLKLFTISLLYAKLSDIRNPEYGYVIERRSARPDGDLGEGFLTEVAGEYEPFDNDLADVL